MSQGDAQTPNPGWNRLLTIDNGRGGTLTFAYAHVWQPGATPNNADSYAAYYQNYYRVTIVTAQDLSGTGASALTTYDYGAAGNATVNDDAHAATVQFARNAPAGLGDSTAYLTHAPRREFRGHATVIERTYDGATLLRTVQRWFFQGNSSATADPTQTCTAPLVSGAVDTSSACFQWMKRFEGMRGQAYKEETRSGATVLTRTIHSYARTDLPFFGGDTSDAQLSNHYQRAGLWRAFTTETQTDAHTLNGTGSAVTQTTKTFYNANCTADTQATILASDGNPLCVQEYDGATLLRSTKRAFVSNAAGTMLDRMWQEAIYDGTGNLIALTNQFYDNTIDANAAPTEGELRRVSRYYDVPGNTSTSTGLTLHGSDTAMTYDVYGNLLTSKTYTGASTRTFDGTSASWGALNGTARTTTTAYDTVFHTLPTQETNPAGHVTRADYDERMGTLLRVTGPNSTDTITDCGTASISIPPTEQSTCAVYDTFGRMVKLIKPGDTSASPAVQATYDDIGRPFRYIVYQKDTSADGVRVQTQFYDGLGRKIQTKAESDNSGAGIVSVVTDTRYDALGRVKAQGQPFYRSESSYGFGYTAPGATLNNETTTSYDALGRVLSSTAPGGRTTQISYSVSGAFTTVATIDPLGHKVERRSDAYGRLRQVIEYTGTSSYSAYATTTYGYTALDLLNGVNDALGNHTTIGYDSLGRKTSMDDPDMGAWSYAYNPTGTLASQTDAKGQTISFGYDALDRLTSKSMAGGWTSGYGYDDATAPNYGIGQRTSMSTAQNGTAKTSTSWQYDARGRMTFVRQGAGTGPLTLALTYDAADRLSTQTLNNETVTTSYDDGGRPSSLCSNIAGQQCYVHDATYTADDQPESWIDGSGVPQTWTYEATTGRLSQLQVGSAGSLFDRTYSYDTADNVTGITDNRAATNSQNFVYDDLNRLTCWKLGSTSCFAFYGYNQIGNLTSKQWMGAYVYPTSGATSVRPHTPSSVNGVAYTYDNNGNLLSGGGRTYTWNADNLPASITGNGTTENYTYDGDGERVLKTAGGVTTVYFQGLFEQTFGVSWKQYYQFNGQTVAVRDSVDGLSYLHGDHLGSVSVATDASGALTSQQEFDPWGAVRGGSVPQTSMNYTGQRLDGTGLLYYHARMYNPVLGRFVSADSVVPSSASGSMDGVQLKPLTVDFHEVGFVSSLNGENGLGFWFQMGGKQRQQAGSPWGPANPQSLNRYSYGLNNPVKNTDPTGHFAAALALPLLAITAPAWVVPVAIGTAVVATAAVVAYVAVQVIHNSDVNAESSSAPLQDFLDKTQPYKGSADDLDYTGTDSAETEFNRLADPKTVQPHPDERLANAGGKIGKIPGGGTVAYRPTSKWTKTPAIDLQGVPGLPPTTKIKWP